MRLPIMLRRTHMQEMTETRRTYRTGLDAAERRVTQAARDRARAEEELRRWTGQFLRVSEPYRRYDRDSVVFPIEVSGHLTTRMRDFSDSGRLARFVGERVAQELLGLHNDTRRDLREQA